MKIIVAEDSGEKIARLRDFFSAVEGIADDDVIYVQSVADARAALRASAFDLLILDVLLPNRPGDGPNHAGTVALLEELATRTTLRKPRHILGLTAYEDAIREAGPAFVSRTWAVVKFAFDNEEWKGQLHASISYIRDQGRQGQHRGYGVDVAIVTALAVPELKAVSALPWEWSPAEPVDDVTFVRRGRFLAGGTTGTVVAASATKMGMIHSALLAAKIIEKERPRFLVMSGICAGVRGKVNFGDVVLGDPAWDWQSGKHAVGDGGPEFAIAPDPLPVSTFVRTRFEQLRADVAFWARVRDEFPGAPETELRLRAGPMATGSSVLADPDIVERVVAQNRSLLALEMEAYGVLAAAGEASHPRPTTFAMKSVCDFADAEKDDSWQAYAAYTSANAVRAFFERYMPEIRELAGTR